MYCTFTETIGLPEVDNRASTSKPMFKKVPEIDDKFASIFEPMFRKVVAEEVDRKLEQYVTFNNPSPPVLPLTQALDTPRFKLVFSNNLLLPIFTGKKILDRDKNPLQIVLVDTDYRNGDQIVPISLDPPPKVELVPLNGNFPPRGNDSWTSQQFNKNIVKERSGKPPLLHGDLLVTLRDGVATIGNIKFTDNSRWTWSGKFKIGARVLARGHTNSSQGCVLEAMTEPFDVREHRMELCKKHHPPMLDDEVWRLKKIGKDGKFHKNLASAGISTVKDFLNIFATDQKRLREILGSKMSDKTWAVVLKHAKTCKIDSNIIPHEQSSVEWVQQVVAENALPAQGTAMMNQPNLNHVPQASEHLNNGGGFTSFDVGPDEFLA